MMKEKIEKRLVAAYEKIEKQQNKVTEHQHKIRELARQSPDLILSAMPMKLLNLQDAVSYLETLQHEVEVLENLLKE